MFVRYLGGGIGHGENTINMETPAVPDEEPGDSLYNQPEKEDDGEESEDGDEDDETSDDSGKGDVEYGDIDEDEPEDEL